VVQRNLIWELMRQERLRGVARRHESAAMCECTFHPKSGGAAYLEIVRGGSSLDFLERSTVWHHLREKRLAFERAVQEEAEGRLQKRCTIHLSPDSEPQFMAPTISTGYRCARDVPLAPPGPGGSEEPCAPQLPEWAAPWSGRAWGGDAQPLSLSGGGAGGEHCHGPQSQVSTCVTCV
jgi:hypothetical protein